MLCLLRDTALTNIDRIYSDSSLCWNIHGIATGSALIPQFSALSMVYLISSLPFFRLLEQWGRKNVLMLWLPMQKPSHFYPYFLLFFLVQVEPFYVTLSLFDIQNGRKISSDFHVDLNHPSVRAMVPSNTSQYINGGGDTHPEGPRLVHGVPEAVLKYPRQASHWNRAKIRPLKFFWFIIKFFCLCFKND